MEGPRMILLANLLTRVTLPELLLLSEACGQHGRAAVSSDRKERCAPERPSQFHIDRYGAVVQAYKTGMNTVVTNGITPFPTAAVRETCGALSPTTAPICFEGASAGYGAAVAKAMP